MAGENGDGGTTRVYAVHLKANHDKALKRLREKYPKPSCFELTQNLFLVKTTDLSETIAETLGIKGEDRDATGVVFRLNTAYSGFYSRTLWEWLDD